MNVPADGSTTPSLQTGITVFPSLDSLSRAVADAVVAYSPSAVAARDRFSIALSGGSTPRRLYELLATTHATRLPWDATYVFFTDERCVPPDHPESNFRMAHDTLISRIRGLDARTHRIEGEQRPDEAAARYDRTLRSFFGSSPEDATFDVCLLGVGADGHTASLFPGSPALDEDVQLAVATEAPPTAAVRQRVTLTFPALDRARTTFVLCAGADKRPILEHIRVDPDAASRYPAARIRAREGVFWSVDAAAAGDASSH